MRTDGTDIYMVRGDYESIPVSCEMDGAPRPFEQGDTVYFTVKRNAESGQKLLQKVVTSFADGVALVEIAPEDTKHLSFARYVYDVQLTPKDGRVKTIIPASAFVVQEEVTDE